MTNFEVIIKEHPQYVKEALACTTCIDEFKRVLAGELEHDECYRIPEDKKEMNFLNAEYVAKPVLDDVEKKYLINVIRPFRYKVKSIRKSNCNGQYFIEINMKDYHDRVCLPYFSTDSKMYKGMKARQYYTLDDLGL